jgi:DNA-binding NarL/FixJ family response regulator
MLNGYSAEAAKGGKMTTSVVLVDDHELIRHGLAGAFTRDETFTVTGQAGTVADGLGVAAIAGKLYISESTAKTHIAKVYEKLGAANRAQALVAAMRMGLIDTTAPPR